VSDDGVAGRPMGARGERVVTVVPGLLDGVRVDRAVAMLTGLSRTAAAELIAADGVDVDGRPVGARSEPLVAGAVLEVRLPPVPGAGIAAEPDVAFTVVYEDDAIIVVDKPPGLVVHPGAGRPVGTLAAGLLARYPELAGVGDPDRPGIVHRLDRGTSGLLVVARTEAARLALVDQLRQRTVERRYLGLVAGSVADEHGVVDAPIGRSTRTPTRMTVSSQGRPARTSFSVVERIAEPLVATLLDLTLDSGRTHQIRVHMAAIGHPVVGDDRYSGPRGGRVGGALLAPGRLFLHAAVLGIVHPSSGRHLRWTSPLPDDLVAVTGPRAPGAAPA
jgi:23S rRNA pseudouridine1911/1915/1917 synthase